MKSSLLWDWNRSMTDFRWELFSQSEQLLWEQGMEEDLQQAQGRLQTQVVWDQISGQLL